MKALAGFCISFSIFPSYTIHLSGTHLHLLSLQNNFQVDLGFWRRGLSILARVVDVCLDSKMILLLLSEHRLLLNSPILMDCSC